MATRRTTVAADSDDLALLEGEARRRGVTLSQVLREAVQHEAERVRDRARPRFGIVHGGGGLAQLSVEDEESPARGQFRS
jgi:hypothetical protein